MILAGGSDLSLQHIEVIRVIGGEEIIHRECEKGEKRDVVENPEGQRHLQD